MKADIYFNFHLGLIKYFLNEIKIEHNLMCLSFTIFYTTLLYLSARLQALYVQLGDICVRKACP